MDPQSNDSLIPCRTCGQFYRTSDTTCPHCGSTSNADGTDPVWRDRPVQILYGPPPSPQRLPRNHRSLYYHRSLYFLLAAMAICAMFALFLALLAGWRPFR